MTVRNAECKSGVIVLECNTAWQEAVTDIIRQRWSRKLFVREVHYFFGVKSSEMGFFVVVVVRYCVHLFGLVYFLLFNFDCENALSRETSKTEQMEDRYESHSICGDSHKNVILFMSHQLHPGDIASEKAAAMWQCTAQKPNPVAATDDANSAPVRNVGS